MTPDNHGDEPTWQLSLRDAEATIEGALAQREADKVSRTFEPNRWAHVAYEVYEWHRAKTYLAAILCGLVARATDDQADPLSLQVGGQPGGYAATSLWQVIQAHAQDRVDLKQLKSQPFNNSPFSGKRRLEASWDNVATFNRPRLERTVDLLNEVAQMSRDEARAALRSFLYAAPAARGRVTIGVELPEGRLDLAKFFEALDHFLLDDGENGRRAQAMVAAALSLVHGESVTTPASINDPSRSEPGDVRVVATGADGVRRALYAEAKQKLVFPEWVEQFVEEVRDSTANGTVAYGALVNDRANERARRATSLPDWRGLVSRFGVVSVVWTNAAEMVRDAIIWSGLDASTAVVRFVELYANFLMHVEAGPATITQWLEVANTFGVQTHRGDPVHE